MLGHEWSGEVLSVGAQVKNVAVGDRVVGECVIGPTDWFGLSIDGAGSREFVVPASVLHLVPEELDDRQAALVEPFTIAYTAMQKVAPCDAGDVVAIVGGGMIGQCAAVIARASGATTVMIEPTSSRRELATAFGADLTIDPEAVADVAGELRRATGSTGASIVVEASGHPAGVASVFDLAAYGAQVVMVGICAAPSIAAPLAQIQTKDLTVRAVAGSAGVWPRALRFLARQGIDLLPLVSHEFDFEEIDPALAQARDTAAAMKILLHP